MNRAFATFDALITASSLIPAPTFEGTSSAMSAAAPMQTMPFNVTGQPALSVPTGLSSAGLPMGLQVVGRAFDEATVLRVGRAVEVQSGWEEVALPAL